MCESVKTLWSCPLRTAALTFNIVTGCSCTSISFSKELQMLEWKRKTSHSRLEQRALFSHHVLSRQQTAASVKAAEPSAGCRLSTHDGGCAAAVWWSFSFLSGKWCDSIQQWFTDGLIQVRNPYPRFLTFASSGASFFLDCVTRASRPRLLMRTLWVHIPFRSVDCVRRHVWAEGKKKKKKKHRGPSKCDKTKRISTFCLPTCVLKSLRESGPSSCQLQVSLCGWVHACVCFPGKIVFLAWPTG